MNDHGVFRSWQNDGIGDDIFRIRLGSMQRNSKKTKSASVVLIGNQMSEAYTRKQNISAKSSAKSELYAAASSAYESKKDGVVAV